MDDLRRHRGVGLVLAGVYSGRATGSHLDQAFARQWVGRGNQSDSLCHLVAGHDRNRCFGARGSPRAAADHSPRLDSGADHAHSSRDGYLVFCLGRRNGL